MNISTTKITGSLNKLMTGAFLMMSTLFLSSCSTKDTPAPDTAIVRFVNAVAGPGTYNVYLNDIQRNTQGALASGGASVYIGVKTGDNEIKFTTASSTISLITKKVYFENNKAYSHFLIGKPDTLNYLTINDERVEGLADKALIRFINLSPDAGLLDLGIKDGAILINDKNYKSASAYKEAEAKTITLQVKDKAGVVKSELANTELKAGRLYTIMSIGMMTPTGDDQKASIKIITNP